MLLQHYDVVLLVNYSMHIIAERISAPRQTKRLGLRCLSNFVVFQYFMPLPSYHSHTMLFTARGICLRTLRISSLSYIAGVPSTAWFSVLHLKL